MKKTLGLVAYGLCLFIILAVAAVNSKAQNTNTVGRIFDIDISGLAVGTALRVNNQQAPPHLLYTVTNLAEVYDSNFANLPCVGTSENPCPPNRGFRSQIPPQYCDGTQRVLRVY